MIDSGNIITMQCFKGENITGQKFMLPLSLSIMSLFSILGSCLSTLGRLSCTRCITHWHWFSRRLNSSTTAFATMTSCGEDCGIRRYLHSYLKLLRVWACCSIWVQNSSERNARFKSSLMCS